MSRVRLRHRWRSPESHRVRIALALKAVEYEAEALAPAEAAPMTEARPAPQTPEPMLEIDGVRLTQSVAIIEYLEETRPDPALLPGAVADRARVRALAQTIATDIAPACAPAVVAHVLWLTGGGEKERVDWVRRVLLRGLERVEAMLDAAETGRFCHGDAPGFADCMLLPQLLEARRFGAPLWRFPRITAVELGCAGHPAFIAAHPAHEAD